MGLSKLASTIFVAMFWLVMVNTADAQSVRPPANAVNQPATENIGTSNTLGNNSSADYWRDLRQGKSGIATSGPGGARLIQAEGELWRTIRKQYIVKYSGWIILSVIALIAVFYLIRGRVRLKGERSGETISRFTLPQRTAHWFMASIFIMLSISGLILLLGRTILAPWTGKGIHSIFASAALQGHNLFGPLFIIALVWIILMLGRGNLFRWVDVKWILKGGGLLGSHASAGHYNFGEKFWFWLVVFGGSTMAVTGMLLEFPWLFGNLQLLQLSTILHAIGAVGLISVAFGHIYIGTLGMEGALESMTTGDVDVVWAKEHHDLWYEEVTGEKVTHGEPEQNQNKSGDVATHGQDPVAEA